MYLLKSWSLMISDNSDLTYTASITMLSLPVSGALKNRFSNSPIIYLSNSSTICCGVRAFAKAFSLDVAFDLFKNKPPYSLNTKVWTIYVLFRQTSQGGPNCCQQPIFIRTYAASICSPRSPCLGDLSFHAFACRIRSVRFLT